jgi:hypothetical protein
MAVVVVFAVVPLGALDAVPLAQRRQVLGGFGLEIALEMAGAGEVGVHLVDVAGVAARLLLGLGPSDGRHIVDAGQHGDGMEKTGIRKEI